MIKTRILPLCLVVVCIFGLLTGCTININLGDSSEKDKNKTEDKTTIIDDFFGRNKAYESRATIHISISNTATAESPAISSSDLTASKSLAGTYSVILNTSTIQNKIKEEYPNIEYELTLEPINETEIYAVIATSEHPEKLEDICNLAVSLLCENVPLIVEGSSCKVIDYAKSTQKVGTN